jgi:hypothetical protein
MRLHLNGTIVAQNKEATHTPERRKYKVPEAEVASPSGNRLKLMQTRERAADQVRIHNGAWGSRLITENKYKP